jgi:predicted GNAT family N-acyltransferase
MTSAHVFTKKDFTIKRLSSHTDLDKFDCSLNDELKLNEFIHKEALQYYRDGLGVTHLFYRHKKLVGYVTLAMGSLRKDKTSLNLVDYNKVNVPALFLGRLAVANSARKSGVGTFLLKYCVDLAVSLNKKTLGCRFVTLVTKKGYRENFYAGKGFRKVVGVPFLDKDLVMMRLTLVPKNKNS